jgi:hypothetical protein
MHGFSAARNAPCSLSFVLLAFFAANIQAWLSLHF